MGREEKALELRERVPLARSGRQILGELLDGHRQQLTALTGHLREAELLKAQESAASILRLGLPRPAAQEAVLNLAFRWAVLPGIRAG